MIVTILCSEDEKNDFVDICCRVFMSRQKMSWAHGPSKQAICSNHGKGVKEAGPLKVAILFATLPIAPIEYNKLGKEKTHC